MGDQEADKKEDKPDQKSKKEEVKFKPGPIKLSDGDDAEADDDKEKIIAEGEADKDDDTGDDDSGDSDDDGQKDDEEDQIVLEGETPPKQVPLPSFLKRVGKLTGQVKEVKGENADLQKENEFLKEENRIYKIAVETKQSQPKPVEIPSPDDFDEGVGDPKYVAKVNEYNQAKIKEGIQQGLSEITKATAVTKVQSDSTEHLRDKVVTHYKDAEKLKVKDYEETEDKAIAAFGQDNFTHLISFLPGRSHIAAYYFGKNPAKAEKYRDMFVVDPGRALIEIGGLLEKVKVKSVNSKDLPDPDDEVEGGKLPSKKKRGPVGAKYE